MRFKFVLLILGAVLAYFGYQEMVLAGVAKPEPQEISCKDLIANGYGDNAHVRISDFWLCDFAYVYEEKGGDWENVWVPVMSLEDDYYKTLLATAAGGIVPENYPNPENISMVFKSSHIRSDAHLTTVGEADTLQGMIVNDVESLGSEERKILVDSYPKADFDKVLILEHRRKPSGSGAVFGMLGGGVALILLGGGLLVAGMRKDKVPPPASAAAAE